MRKLARIFILVVIAYIALIYLPVAEEHLKNDEALPKTEKRVEKVDSKINGIQGMIGLDAEEVMKQYGMPTRRYPSMYGYEWWVYFNDENPSTYFQVGVENDKIVTLYVIGEDIPITPFHIGDSYKEIAKKFPFVEELSFSRNESDYTFSLSESELTELPLIQLEDNEWAQLYFDTFENKLSSIRFLNTDVLLLQRPYKLMYTNELPALPQLTDDEIREVDREEEQTIFELTNIIRARFDLPTLAWDEKAAEVALSHSKDMRNNKFFSHTSPTAGDLGDRIRKGGVAGSLFAENISANFIDGIAATEGWMNSAGHRENMLQKNFTSLGVGVYNRYYTQNFVGADNSGE